MSNYLPGFWLAVTGLLSGVVDAPIYRRSQANRYNWKDEIENGSLPDKFWIVDVRADVEDPDTPTDTVCYRKPLTIFFVRRATLTTEEADADLTIEDAVEATLASTRDAFIGYSGTAFQLLNQNPTTNISDENPANQVFYDLEADFFAAAFEVNPLVGEVLGT